ncbi:hypothetical protein L208DRAFT_1247768 [Tricholoma matsutake]|nr:hypothetical protein L208DRAFT_1247768 [Tricholoma matsutake 945]
MQDDNTNTDHEQDSESVDEVINLDGTPPPLNTSLQINYNGAASVYLLRGVIYYANQHFTAHFLNTTGDTWHHDGMARGGALTLERPSQALLATAIMAMYSLG